MTQVTVNIAIVHEHMFLVKMAELYESSDRIACTIVSTYRAGCSRG